MKKQSWINKFEVVGIIPGKILFHGMILDLSDEKLPLEKVQKLYDSGCKYLKLKEDTKPDKNKGEKISEENLS